MPKNFKEVDRWMAFDDFLNMPGHGLIADSFQEFLDKIVPLA